MCHVHVAVAAEELLSIRLEKELSHKGLLQGFRRQGQVGNGTEVIVVAGVG